MSKLFKRVDEARYDEMLGALPPAYHDRGGFLVGEPWTHRECKVSGDYHAAFAAFVQHDGKFYESNRAMTRPEYMKFRREFAFDRSLVE